MKKVIVLLFAMFVGFSTIAQKSMKNSATVVSLTQTTGDFVQKELILKPGKYVFEIENAGVKKEVGFWLRTTSSDAPLANSDKAGLIKTNTKSKTGVVELVTGEYYYSCPLNPTPTYKIIVK